MIDGWALVGCRRCVCDWIGCFVGSIRFDWLLFWAWGRGFVLMGWLLGQLSCAPVLCARKTLLLYIGFYVRSPKLVLSVLLWKHQEFLVLGCSATKIVPERIMWHYVILDVCVRFTGTWGRLLRNLGNRELGTGYENARPTEIQWAKNLRFLFVLFAAKPGQRTAFQLISRPTKQRSRQALRRRGLRCSFLRRADVGCLWWPS